MTKQEYIRVEYLLKKYKWDLLFEINLQGVMESYTTFCLPRELPTRSDYPMSFYTAQSDYFHSWII